MRPLPTPDGPPPQPSAAYAFADLTFPCPLPVDARATLPSAPTATNVAYSPFATHAATGYTYPPAPWPQPSMSTEPSLNQSIMGLRPPRRPEYYSQLSKTDKVAWDCYIKVQKKSIAEAQKAEQARAAAAKKAAHAAEKARIKQEKADSKRQVKEWKKWRKDMVRQWRGQRRPNLPQLPQQPQPQHETFKFMLAPGTADFGVRRPMHPGDVDIMWPMMSRTLTQAVRDQDYEDRLISTARGQLLAPW